MGSIHKLYTETQASFQVITPVIFPENMGAILKVTFLLNHGDIFLHLLMPINIQLISDTFIL